MRKPWSRLIRFVASDGGVHTGDAILSAGVSDVREAKLARTIRGDPFGSYTFGPTRPIERLLCPLPYEKIRTVRLLGLNYRKHAAETKLPEPEYPIVFHKPATAVSGPIDDIPVSEMAQEGGAAVDYEAELVVVIGRACRNVPVHQALGAVAGYTLGNDVSQREWQMKRGGGQWNVSKMFDGSAPIGPCIASPGVISDVQSLRLRSWVNGEARQNETTRDMIFGVAETIAFLSRGATLMPGDLLFMGTPAGVGMGFNPPRWLRDGDVVECSAEHIGSIRNVVRFVKDPAEQVAPPPSDAMPSRRRRRPLIKL